MAFPDHLWSRISSNLSISQCLAATTALFIAYCISRVIYNLYFDPLSNYPGPKLAALTDIWWAYASTTGRYPWIIENVLKQYGDVVRIAPNELVFLTPQAGRDIYLSQEKNLELFVQLGYDSLDTGDGGISGETNPVKHREIAKKLAPAFSTRNFKAKEATVLKHIDTFIEKMKIVGKEGVELQRWVEWLALDLSADLTYGREMGQMQDMKDSILLSATLKLNLFLTMSQITRKFRLLAPLMYLTIPPSVWFVMPRLIKMNAQDVKARIERRGKTEHLDYFEHLVPADKPIPKDEKQIYHLQNIAGQLLLASWQPLANQFFSFIFFLSREPDAYTALVEEVRTAFADHDAINTESTANLKYLQACVSECLRLHQDTVDGLSRVSPGALVDGINIPQGVSLDAPSGLRKLTGPLEWLYLNIDINSNQVTCQISYFAAARSPRFFAEPLKFLKALLRDYAVGRTLSSASAQEVHIQGYT
ncbi:hypothetical protein VP1G_05332 [Cytospora mali]|uniref:Trichodiene oxygenase n=1 Tax=Cytospora mali TaxID=578113 RepID=A0A194V253_CYTMA|nr:hypothetical protein VP1G_05332 [Valsa mali var. pyri (nom. inval.)]